MTNNEILGIKFGEMNTVEFQELIPGIKLPAIPLIIPGLEKLPLLPGWTVKSPAGAVLAEGARLPTLGKKKDESVLGAGGAYYPPAPYYKPAPQYPAETYYPPETHYPPAEAYYPEQLILDETEGLIEPMVPLDLLEDEPLELGDDDAVSDSALSGNLTDEALEL